MGKKVTIGKVGLVAAAAAWYFLYHGKAAAQRRQAIRGWVLKAKGEVVERLENVRDVSQEAYDGAIDTVVARYRKAKGVSPAELASLARELKGQWKSLRRELAVAVRPKVTKRV